MTTQNPGNRPLSLAGHLRSLASLLKSDAIEYSWIHQERCNCGLLARAITGLSPSELMAVLNPLINRGEDKDRSWRGIVSQHCPLTGQPTHELFKKLYDAGLRFNDFGELERLTNPEVVRRMLAEGYTITDTKKHFFRADEEIKRPFTQADINRMNGTHLAAYMAAWASLIEEHHAANPARPTDVNVATEAQLEAVELRPLVTTEK